MKPTTSRAWELVIASWSARNFRPKARGSFPEEIVFAAVQDVERPRIDALEKTFVLAPGRPNPLSIEDRDVPA